jgi:hypothetical protein
MAFLFQKYSKQLAQISGGIIVFCLALLPWMRWAKFPIQGPFEVFSAAFATGLVVVLSTLMIHSFRRWRDGLDVTSKILTVLIMIVCAAVWLRIFPGAISPDDLNILTSLEVGRPSYWHSFMYSYLLQSCIFLTNRGLMVSLVNYILFCAVAVSTFQLFQKRRLEILKIIPCILLLNAAAISLVFFENRDSVFSLVVILISLELLLVQSRFEKPDLKTIGMFSILAVFVSNIRGEFVFFVVAWPVLIWLASGFNLGVLIKSIITTMLMYTLMVILPAPYFPTTATQTDMYESTLFINPLTWIVQKKGLGELSPEETTQMSRFMNVTDLKDFGNPNMIAAYNRDGRADLASHEDYLAFRSAALKVISRNSREWIGNRIYIGLVMMNLLGETYFLSDHLAGADMTPAILPHYFLQPRDQEVISNPEHWWIKQWIMLSFVKSQSDWRLVFGALLPLFGFLFWMWPSKRNLLRIEFWLASLMVLRLIALIALAPAPYFKYISSQWLLGWIFLFLGCYESSVTARRFRDLRKKELRPDQV